MLDEVGDLGILGDVGDEARCLCVAFGGELCDFLEGRGEGGR